MAVKNVGGHGVSTVAGHHNTQAMSAQPTFAPGPQSDLSNSSHVPTPAARPQKKTGFPPASGNGAASAAAGPGPSQTPPVSSQASSPLL